MIGSNSIPWEVNAIQLKVTQNTGSNEANQRRPVERDERQEGRERQRNHRARDQFRSRRPVGPDERHSREDLLDELGMHFNARCRRIERSGDDVGKPGGAEADEN